MNPYRSAPTRASSVLAAVLRDVHALLEVVCLFAMHLVAGLMIGWACMAMLGCAATLQDNATNAANTARAAEVAAGDMLRERCTERYKAAARELTGQAIVERVKDLDYVCVPARKAYGVLRASRLALLAAILAYKVTQNEGALLDALQHAAQAAVEASAAARRLED